MNSADLENDLERLHESSFGWALACCRWQRAEAEEALQAAYLKAIDGRARFNGHASVKTWFFGVVRRTAAEQRRKRFVREIGQGRWLRRRADEAPGKDPEQTIHEAESQRRLRAALRQLAPRQRDLLQLVFYHELTVEEAADALHLKLGTARTHYERGKARLKALLAETGGR